MLLNFREECRKIFVHAVKSSKYRKKSLNEILRKTSNSVQNIRNLERLVKQVEKTSHYQDIVLKGFHTMQTVLEIEQEAHLSSL